MSLKEKIEALGEDVSADLKAILHELATLAGVAAPVAEAVETVVAPEDVAPTEAAAAVAEVVAKDTTA
jgi:N-acetylglucosamine-6-phosphate deacetylase